MSEEISVLLGQIDVKLEHIVEELAKHQEAIANLAESVMSIKLERAKERGYFLGAIAVGSLAGGLIEKFLKL
ncbi:MAG: hypothetical protein LBQ19_01080 [Synergistaceae bacterium]|jgi:hypothetical protein|nr:hypothetical protein [Synergistaceae bacterium]